MQCITICYCEKRAKLTILISWLIWLLDPFAKLFQMTKHYKVNKWALKYINEKQTGGGDPSIQYCPPEFCLYFSKLLSPSQSPSPPVPKGPQLNPKKFKVKSYFWTGSTLKCKMRWATLPKPTPLHHTKIQINGPSGQCSCQCGFWLEKKPA